MSAVLLRKQGPDLPAIAPTATDQRLRCLILRRDTLASELAEIDAIIANLARRYADEHGETLRPTLPDLRRRLGQ